MLKLWLKKWLIYAVLNFQQSLQNRVPRVRVLLPLPSKNGLNTAFKPFFDIFLCTEHGLIFPFWHSFQASKCPTVANNSNVSVCYIIKIASKLLLHSMQISFNKRKSYDIIITVKKAINSIKICISNNSFLMK